MSDPSILDPARLDTAAPGATRSAPGPTWAQWDSIDHPGAGARALQFQLQQSFASQQRWSPRRAAALIIGSSALLWAAIGTVVVSLLG